MTRIAGVCLLLLLLGPPVAGRAAFVPARAWSATDSSTVAALNHARDLVNDGREAEAEPLLTELLPRVERAYGPHSLAVADVLDLLADVAGLGGEGRVAEVRGWLDRALVIRDAAANAAPLAHALTLHRLALLHRNQGEFAAADSALTRGLALLREAGLKSTATGAFLLATRAQVAAKAGDFDRAESALDRADTIVARLPAPVPVLPIRLVAVRADLRRQQQRVEAAIELRRRAVAEAERERGPEGRQVADALSQLGTDLTWGGHLDESLAVLRRALAIHQRQLGPDAVEISNDLNNLVMVEMDRGDYSAARRDGDRALAILRKALGPEHPDALALLNNLGILAYQTGDWERARSCFEQVLAADRKTYGNEHLYVADDLGNLAAILYYTGDAEESVRLFDQAVAVATAVGGADHPQVGRALANEGEVLAALGRTQQARVAFARGLALFEAGVGADNPDVATLRDSYGKLLASLGEDDAAQEQLEKALAIQVAVLGEHHPDTALSRQNLANLQLREGHAQQAVAMLEGVCHDMESGRGPHDPRLAEALVDLAAARWRAGERDSVLAPALRAETIGREHLRLVARGLPERQALAYAAARPAGLDLAVSAAEASGTTAAIRAAWDAVIRSRGLVLDEMVARRATDWLPSDSTSARLAAQLARARERYANLSVRGPGELDPAVFRRELDDAREVQEATERELARRSVALRRVDQAAGAGWDPVARAFPPGAALLAYRRHRDGEGRECYAAFVLAGRGRPPQLVRLGDATSIDSLVTAWRDAVAAGAVPPGPLSAAAEANSRAAGARLRQAIWDPVQPLLGQPDRVLVVPDGALHLVNLAALPAGEDRYLVEDGPVFHLLSRERDLLSAGQPTTGRGLLAMGGPDFDAQEGSVASGSLAVAFRGAVSPCGDFAGLRFTPLPGAEAEARAVGASWRASGQRGEAEVLSGSAAAEAVFKREAPGKRVLHLATHGFFLGEGCGRRLDGDRAVPGELTTTSPVPDDPSLENPLVLSGVALAAANRRGEASPGQEDGVLTAEEIASLDLEGTRWAVLSGCDTGRGTAAVGEGLLGLQRAFQVAGVHTVISSLWAVRDEDARLWMEAFYRAALAGGQDTADAVRTASLRVLAERRADGSSGNPLSWAAFVAMGDWR